MARATAPVGGRPELRLPRIRPWWDDSAWTAFASTVEERAASAALVRPVAASADTPAGRVPELTADTRPESGDGEPEREARRTGLTSMVRDLLRKEVTDLSIEISLMRHGRDQLREELRELNDRLAILGGERDGLLAAVTPLRAELAELQSKDRQLGRLESEIQALRHQKASLDREILNALRGTTESPRGLASKRRFDDS